MRASRLERPRYPPTDGDRWRGHTALTVQRGEVTGVAPVTASERVGELDVLRGFALLGVLLVHLNTWPAAPLLATDAQWAELTAPAVDRTAEFFVSWLFYDKANTLFAFLFGVGFWVQMQRMEARGANFSALYLRRLMVLLIIGVLNMVFVWQWDILNLYALAGFALFAVRDLRDRTLLFAGLLLALTGRPVADFLFESSGLTAASLERAFSQAEIFARQTTGTYWEAYSDFARLNWLEWLSGGVIVGWFFYALGRFMVGAYVARRGWIQRAREMLPQYRFWMAICLPLGLAGEFLAASLSLETMPALSSLAPYARAFHYLSVPLLAAGYLCLIIVIFHSRAAGLVRLFAPVGRMALTNYVLQGVFIAFLLYDFPPALGLLGEIGPARLTVYGLSFFALQIIASHVWLGWFAYGPLEWVWRALTYSKRPTMRRQVALGAG